MFARLFGRSTYVRRAADGTSRKCPSRVWLDSQLQAASYVTSCLRVHVTFGIALTHRGEWRPIKKPGRICLRTADRQYSPPKEGCSQAGSEAVAAVSHGRHRCVLRPPVERMRMLAAVSSVISVLEFLPCYFCSGARSRACGQEFGRSIGDESLIPRCYVSPSLGR